MIGKECSGADKGETETETKRESQKERGREGERARDEGKFIALARLHARKFDKDVV